MKIQEQIKINNAVRLLLAYLAEYPELIYEHTLNSITVPASDVDGFTVKFEVNDSEKYIVSYGQWRRKFRNEGEAVFFFLKGLTPECRVKIEVSGEQGITHTAEHHTDRTWHSEGAKTLEKRKSMLELERTRFLQNQHIDPVFI